MFGSATDGFWRPSRSVSSKKVTSFGKSRPLRFDLVPVEDELGRAVVAVANPAYPGVCTDRCAMDKLDSNRPSSRSFSPARVRAFGVASSTRCASSSRPPAPSVSSGRKTRAPTVTRRASSTAQPGAVRGDGREALGRRSASTRRASSRRRGAPTSPPSSIPRASVRACRISPSAPSPTASTHALLLFLHEGGVLFGLAGLERRGPEGEFTEEDMRAARGARPRSSSPAPARRSQYDELSREAVGAPGARPRQRHALRRRPRQEARRLGGRPRARHRLGRGRRAARGPARRRGGAVARGARPRRRAADAAAPPHGVRRGRRASIDDDPVFGGARCAVVRVEAPTSAPRPSRA